jgi:hypothetical protein
MNMKKLTAILAAAGLICATSGIALASDTATQTVTYEVAAINELSVSGNPGALIVSTATAGSAPDAVSDATTTYAITTNESDRKITAAIDTAMPAGVTLTANLAAPTVGTSTGAVALTATAVDLVTGISTLNESAKTITYGLSATPAAGVVASASKVVTLTITAGI